MQLDLLDQVAGCSVQATQMAACWHRHQELEVQLRDLAAVGNPEQQQALLDLVESVRSALPATVWMMLHLPGFLTLCNLTKQLLLCLSRLRRPLCLPASVSLV